MLPNQIIATLETLIISIITGIIDATNWFTRMATSVTSRLAISNRCSSCFSRLNARTTRTPVKFSSKIRLSLSNFDCMTLNNGTALVRRKITTPISTGMIATRIQESPTSWFKARMIPTTSVSGAVMSIFRIITITC